MDVEIGRGMVNASRDYMSKSIHSFSLNAFKPYFNISNTYIMRKLLIIVFPFNTKWTQTSISNPDLYIPLMSFLTYLLLTSFLNNFAPEKLGMLFTRSVTLEIIYTVIVKMVGYFLDANIKTLDFIAFSGYKFVMALLINLIYLKYVRFVWKLYLYFAFFFFMSRSLKVCVEGGDNRRRKAYFVFIVVFGEIIITMFL